MFAGRARLTLAALLLIGCGGGATQATVGGAKQPAPGARGSQIGNGRGGVRLVKVGDFKEPVHLAQPPGEKRLLFVVQKGGRIMVIRAGKKLARPFLDLSGEVSGASEQGLLSVAFGPDYSKSRRFYVFFTDRRGDERVQEFRRSRSSSTRAEKSSRRNVLTIKDFAENHNGGLALFGPDGLLYAGLGDGGGGGDPERNGQKLSSPLGKLLRIDPRPAGGKPYRIPADNPFAGRAGARPEVYSYGLRNPWRYSFDRDTGDLLIADVGQDEFEEVDFARKGEGRGANFGWSAFEGRKRFNDDQSAPGQVEPILVTSHGDGNCSITGGYVVRDRGLPSLYGRYVYGDFCNAPLRSLVPATPGARDDRAVGPKVEQLSSFGEDTRGRIYALSLAGPVFRLAPE